MAQHGWRWAIRNMENKWRCGCMTSWLCGLRFLPIATASGKVMVLERVDGPISTVRSAGCIAIPCLSAVQYESSFGRDRLEESPRGFGPTRAALVGPGSKASSFSLDRHLCIPLRSPAAQRWQDVTTVCSITEYIGHFHLTEMRMISSHMIPGDEIRDGTRKHPWAAISSSDRIGTGVNGCHEVVYMP